MFLLPALAALQETGRRSRRESAPGWTAAIILALLVGWRDHVGGDWEKYLRNFEGATYHGLGDVIALDDPGYRLIEWIAIEAGWGIHSVNLVGGVLFAGGLVWFCRSLPRPWLALAVAVPYLILVVGMGYTRQGMALGCAMVGMVAFGRGRVLELVLWTLLGATFHKSAVLLLPFAALASSRGRLATIGWVGAVTAVAYVLLVADSVERLRTNYLEAQYQSQGALIRLLMNAVPAGFLLWGRHRFAEALGHNRLWWWFALASLFFLALYFVTPSSTAIDRLALYFLPLQLVVAASLPNVLGRRDEGRQAVVAAILVYYAVVLFVWLNFAENSLYWIPYRFYPIELLARGAG
jgi:hypothetical protein